MPPLMYTPRTPSGTPTPTLTYKVLPKRDKYFGSLQYKKIAPENFAMKTSTTFREEISYIAVCLLETVKILGLNLYTKFGVKWNNIRLLTRQRTVF